LLVDAARLLIVFAAGGAKRGERGYTVLLLLPCLSPLPPGFISIVAFARCQFSHYFAPPMSFHAAD
jgi:hypothetical protein